MQKFLSKHPDPDGDYWTIWFNRDLSQQVDRIKEITTSSSLGIIRKGYFLFNPNGAMIGLQTYQEPIIEAPNSGEDSNKNSFNVNFKMPKELGLFPPYNVLVSLLKRGKDEDS